MAEIGGLIHDLGKIGIPDAIPHKGGQVTPEEYRILRLHPEIGRDIVVNHAVAPLVERPECIGTFVLHFAGDTFDFERTGSRSGLHVRRINLDTVEDALRHAPKVVDLPEDER